MNKRIEQLAGAYQAGVDGARNLRAGDHFTGCSQMAIAAGYDRDSAAYHLFLDGFLSQTTSVIMDASNNVKRVEYK